MKISLNGLRQYVDVPGTPETLAERLTFLGLEVESITRIGGDFEGIVVAQVLSRDRHPNADKLSLCRVADGQGERQIVCGAQNFQAGDKVPLILPGASLPLKPGDKEPFTIKVGKIRGVESHGMLCSAAELGIRPEDIGHRPEDGLLILRPDAPVGQPFAGYLGRSGSDAVLDLEVTPNRPDWNSFIGIARDLAAATGTPLRMPDPRPPEAGAGVSGSVAVRLEAPDLCPRYTARVIRGVRIGPSPDWLRTALETLGIRSINNVVDVTNYVMLETGQPLHAFDLRHVSPGPDGRASIVVRRAGAGEAFTTLDGVARTLIDSDLLIADPVKGIALAGIMGGRNSEIADDTTDVLIESAAFSATGIRRTSKALGLRTDASYRFERGADLGICEFASRRCAEWILQTAGGTLEAGVVDVQPSPFQPVSIALRPERTTALLGVEIPAADQEAFLIRLGLDPIANEGESGALRFRVPSWRVDLKREADLIEEVARLYGVERIPSTPPRGAVGAHPFDALHDHMASVRGTLAAMGLMEAQGQTLVAEAAARRVSADVVLLANPLSSDMSALRPSLLPGLLDTLRHNLARRSADLQLFEIGRVFTAAKGGEAGVREGWRVAMALTGARNPAFWSGPDREARCDLYDAKGLIEELLETLGIRGVQWNADTSPSPFWLESAAVALGGKLPLGRIGRLQPTVGRDYDLRDPVFLAELDLDLLLSRAQRSRSFKALPQFPAVRRDLALLVPESVTHEAVLGVVRKAQLPHLEAVELFDVFRGRHVAEGSKSLAYTFTYRATDRTLKEDEVNAAQIKLVTALKSGVQAVIRE
ncbi:MAG: phenylalanine--tRNA ligase subunit beta [Verrucomicrobia bacterium]|nr:phenylalanine--tRNA ligase subunit beta [Verrucomicrobiota bacterium]